MKYKRLKLKLRMFLAGHSVAMVTYSVTEMIPTCPPVIGHNKIYVLESAGNCFEPP